MAERKISEDEYLYQARMRDENALIRLMDTCMRYSYARWNMLAQLNTYTDRDEVRQKAQIGIMKAIDCYRTDQQAGILYFASICAQREVYSLLRHERRKGILGNPNIISLDSDIRMPTDASALIDVMADQHEEFQPEIYARKAQRECTIQQILAQLSENEQQVLRYRRQRMTYNQISQYTGLSTKQVDYTLRRAKKRIRARVDYQN